MRKYHPRLPTTHEQEEERIQQVQLQSNNAGMPTSFILATAAAGSRWQQLEKQFDNKVCIILLLTRGRLIISRSFGSILQPLLTVLTRHFLLSTITVFNIC